MKVGFITIGQSPRNDILEDIAPVLKRQNIEYKECGALDNLTTEEIKQLEPESESDYILITRLRNGSQVKLSRAKILTKIQACIKELEQSVGTIAILCTGEFPELTSNKRLVEPSILLKKIVESISSQAQINVLIPSADQENEVREKLRLGVPINIFPISPYISLEKELGEVANNIDNDGIIIMDCLGYSQKMKSIIKTKKANPVLLPRTLLASIISELS